MGRQEEGILASLNSAGERLPAIIRFWNAYHNIFCWKTMSNQKDSNWKNNFSRFSPEEGVALPREGYQSRADSLTSTAMPKSPRGTFLLIEFCFFSLWNPPWLLVNLYVILGPWGLKGTFYPISQSNGLAKYNYPAAPFFSHDMLLSTRWGGRGNDLNVFCLDSSFFFRCWTKNWEEPASFSEEKSSFIEISTLGWSWRGTLVDSL